MQSCKQNSVKAGSSPCAFCGSPSTGIVNGQAVCSVHASQDKTAAERRPSMDDSLDKLASEHKVT